MAHGFGGASFVGSCRRRHLRFRPAAVSLQRADDYHSKEPARKSLLVKLVPFVFLGSSGVRDHLLGDRLFPAGRIWGKLANQRSLDAFLSDDVYWSSYWRQAYTQSAIGCYHIGITNGGPLRIILLLRIVFYGLKVSRLGAAWFRDREPLSDLSHAGDFQGQTA